VRQQDTKPPYGDIQLNLCATPSPPFQGMATSPSLIVCIDLAYLKLLQELSYRKHITRQLRTQYVEGIYDNPVTLKSRLRDTRLILR